MKRKFQDILFFGFLCILGIDFYMFRKYYEKPEHKDVTQTIGIFFEIVIFLNHVVIFLFILYSLVYLLFLEKVI